MVSRRLKSSSYVRNLCGMSVCISHFNVMNLENVNSQLFFSSTFQISFRKEEKKMLEFLECENVIKLEEEVYSLVK